jgi:hypothetical protein
MLAFYATDDPRVAFVGEEVGIGVLVYRVGAVVHSLTP